MFQILYTTLALLAAVPGGVPGDGHCPRCTYSYGAVIRGDSTRRALTLVLTGDGFADGGEIIREALHRTGVPAAFFFTGNFYRNSAFAPLIVGLRADGHYLGAHSDRHLLYCSWEDREHLLVGREEFLDDLAANYREMERFGIDKSDAPYFLPPFEWYNDRIAAWTADFGLQLINFTPGTRSNADYTTPEMPNYRDSDTIYGSILEYEKSDPNGLNGFLLLVHIGVDPARTDKFYRRLEPLIRELQAKGYEFTTLKSLLE